MITSVFVGYVLLINLLVLLGLNLGYFILTNKVKSIELENKTYGFDASGFNVNLTGLSSTFMIGLWGLTVIEFLQQPHWLDPVIMEVNDSLQIIGMVMVIFGSFVFIISRISRGIIAPAWGLNDQMKLIKIGPYKIIRHPSYLAYCIWFIFLPLATGVYLFVLFIPGIYGYIKVIETEEKMLKLHFGEEFDTYRSQTRKLVPFIY